MTALTDRIIKLKRYAEKCNLLVKANLQQIQITVYSVEDSPGSFIHLGTYQDTLDFLIAHAEAFNLDTSELKDIDWKEATNRGAIGKKIKYLKEKITNNIQEEIKNPIKQITNILLSNLPEYLTEITNNPIRLTERQIQNDEAREEIIKLKETILSLELLYDVCKPVREDMFDSMKQIANILLQ